MGSTPIPGSTDESPYSSDVLNFLWHLKKRGYKETTIEQTYSRILRNLAKHCDFNNPETILEYIANKHVSSGRKELIINCYINYCKFTGPSFIPPRYKRTDKLPYVPLETDVEALISALPTKLRIFTKVIKETGARPGELWKLGSDLVGGCGEKVCDSMGTYSVSWDGFDTHQTVSTGALSPAPPELSIKVAGGLDYSEKENVKIRLAALVKDATTREAVSIADVTIKIYYLDGTLWVSDKMVESLSGSGIYEWESSKTIVEMKLKDGVYLVHIKASVRNGPVASDMLLFHIDSLCEATSLTPLLYYATAVVILAVGTIIGIVLLRRHRRSQISQ